MIVIARDMDSWFNNSSGLLDEGDERKSARVIPAAVKAS